MTASYNTPHPPHASTAHVCLKVVVVVSFHTITGTLPFRIFNYDFVDSGYVDVNVIICPENKPRWLSIAAQDGPI